MSSKIAFAALCLSCVGVSAGAATFSVTFDLSGDDLTASTTQNIDGLPSDFSLTQNGLTAKFDGKTVDSVIGRQNTFVRGDFEDAKIGRFATGAGVFNGVGDSYAVSGGSLDDFIEISFDRDVRIMSMTFGNYGPRSSFRILTEQTGNNAIGIGDAYSSTVGIARSDGSYSFDDDTSVNFLAVGAFTSKDWWTLSSITVSFDDATIATTAVSPVPVPAAAWMLIAALGGFGLIGWRKIV